MTQPKVLAELDPAECRQRLREAQVGRLGYIENGVPVIRPVNFTVIDDSVVVWTVPTGHSGQVVGHPVAFEVDHVDPATRSGWTVLINGPATAVHDVDQLVAAASAPRRPWVSAPHDHVVRVGIDRISGHRLPASRPRG